LTRCGNARQSSSSRPRMNLHHLIRPSSRDLAALTDPYASVRRIHRCGPARFISST
jgi:hypothetical protein